MSYIQADLFEMSETEKLRSEIRGLEKCLDNVRRGIFQRHDELGKKYMQLREEFESMTEKMRHYEAALFPVDAAGIGCLHVGQRLTDAPVSSLMISSQACSTGLF
jgi:hypothetical protein